MPLDIKPFLHERYAKIKHSFLSSKNIPIFLYPPTSTNYNLIKVQIQQSLSFSAPIYRKPQNSTKFCGYNRKIQPNIADIMIIICTFAT